MTTKIRTFGGNLGIGTTDPGSYRLRVDGGLKSTSMEVDGVTNAHIPSGAIAMWHGLFASIPTGWVLCNGSNGTPDLRDKMIRAAAGDVAPSPTVLNATSGSNNVTMSANQLPQHTHQVGTQADNSPHTHYFDGKNAPHGHYSRNGGYHAHGIHGVSWRRLAGWDNMNHHGSGTGGWAIWPLNNNTNHSCDYNPQHTHNSSHANVPHAHNSNAHQAPHSHGTQIGQAGGNSSLAILNRYRALYYIMKT